MKSGLLFVILIVTTYKKEHLVCQNGNFYSLKYKIR